MSQTLEAPQSPRANFIYADAHGVTMQPPPGTTPKAPERTRNKEQETGNSEHALQRATACTLNYDLIRI